MLIAAVALIALMFAPPLLARRISNGRAPS
jgi:hypothetical protein